MNAENESLPPGTEELRRPMLNAIELLKPKHGFAIACAVVWAASQPLMTAREARRVRVDNSDWLTKRALTAVFFFTHAGFISMCLQGNATFLK